MLFENHNELVGFLLSAAERYQVSTAIFLAASYVSGPPSWY